MNQSAVSYSGTDAVPHSVLSVTQTLPVQEVLNFHSAQTPHRTLVERYIAKIFRRIHGAKITEFMPVLLSMGTAKATKSALGMRRASNGPLFLESYLDAPVEQLLASAGVATTQRHDIVEIGNLSSTRPGHSQILFILLTSIMRLANVRTVTFCGTAEVVSLMEKLGMQLIELGDASEERVAPTDTDWGSYYAKQPKVCAVNVEQAFQALQRCELACELIENYQPQLAEIARQL